MSVSSGSVILDTNIIRYIGNKSISIALNSYLQELTERSFIFTLSEITIFESLAFSKLHQEIKIATTLNNFIHKPITKEVLATASWLTKLYSAADIPFQQISTEDDIIAATALLTSSLILTANVNDFPRPFFTEYEEKLIFYNYKNRKRMIAIYMLEPNIPFIKEKFNEEAN